MPRRTLALHALLGALVGLALLLWPPASVQRVWLDAQLRWAAPQSPPAGVLVYDIDDAALATLRAEFGPWPLGRDTYARVVDALREAGARAVVLNLVLADPREGDSALARSLARREPPVLLAVAGVPSVLPTRGVVPDGHVAWAAFSQPAAGLTPEGQTPRLGVITTPLEADGHLRHWHLHHAAPQGRWPLMPLAVLGALHEPQRLAPDAQGRVTPLVGIGAGGVRTLSFAPLARAARERRLTDESLRAARGQVVFIGASAQLADTVMTAVGQQHGTALLAQTYAALRDGRGVQALSPMAGLGLLALGLVPALWAVLAGRTRPAPFAAAAVLVLAALATLLLTLAPRWGLWMDASPALGALALTALLHLAGHQRHAQQQAAHLLRERQLADAANQAKSEFLANVSHELRTPLSAVLGLSELLAQSHLTDVQRRHVELLGGAGRSLLTLIDELLDLSRIEMQRFQLHPAPTHLPSLLEDAVAISQARAGGRPLHCDLALDPDLPPWVLVDAQRLSQVLLNLLGNAIKFTPRGRVSLHASLEQAGRVQFAVSDTGIGIASSQLQRIFEPFVQSQGQAARYGGTGLGLAISRELVRLMGGDIEVHSVPGAGSSFSFSLPLAACEPAQAEPAHTELPTAGLHVLLAEDDDVIAEVTLAQLAPVSPRVERATNGHLALALFQRMRFDLVLLDLQLPGLDGHRVVRSLREHERRHDLPRTPVLALSAHAHADDARASLAAGCDAHLSKPVSQQRLLQALRRWAPEEPVGVTPGWAAAPPPTDPERLRRAEHATVFLGRWGAVWADARGNPESARALLRDLLDCADGLGASPLREAGLALEQLLNMPAVPVLRQHALEQALQAAVEATLLDLRAL